MEPAQLQKAVFEMRMAARKGAKVFRQYFRSGRLQINHKKPVGGMPDFNTQAEFEIEETIDKHLEKIFPTIGFWGEEKGDKKPHQDAFFILDPVDGTTNFIAGHKTCCISLALVENDEIIAGVINIPALNEEFWAAKDQGAFMRQGNTMLASAGRIRVSPVTQMHEAMIACEESIGREGFDPAIYDRIAFGKKPRVRQFGSAAFSLAYVAAGYLDGMFRSDNVHLCDIAAGVILVKEAGGKVSDITGNDKLTFDRTPSIVAGTPAIYDLMRQAVDKKPAEDA